MAHFYRDQQSPPYEIQSPHIMPLKYGEVPGEYEAQYRPDANTYHQDKKTSSYGVVQPVAVPQGDRPNYKPGPLRWPLLCALIIVLLGLIAATEWACHTLPVEDRQRPLPTTAVSSQPMATTTPTPTATPLLMARQESPQSEAQASTTAPPDSNTSPPASDGWTTTADTLRESDIVNDGPTTVSYLAPSDVVDGNPTTITDVVDESPKTITSPGNGGTVVTGVPPTTNYVDLGPTTINGVPTTIAPTYVAPQVTTLTNWLGVPTAVITSTPSAISTPTVVALTDSNGATTGLVTTSALAAPIVTTLTDAAGNPTATATQYAALPTLPATNARVFSMSKLDHFVGFFLAPIVCVLLTIPIRMIDLTAKQLQPFHELTHPLGASAHESLTLETGGLYGVMTSVRSLFGGHPLVFLTTLLTICSVLLVPLSAEAVGANVYGSCTQTSFKGCAMTLGVFLLPARATMALLAFMVVVLVFLLVFLARWRSGIATNPWSIAGIASLSTNSDVRALFAALPTGRDGRIAPQRLVDALEGRTFKLDYFFNRHGEPEYGIVIDNEAGRGLQGPGTPHGIYPGAESGVTMPRKTQHHLPFLMLTYTWRIAFLVLLTGLLALIFYYNNTGGDTPFELFMSTQNFGVRFLFTLVGIAITLFWSSFFSSVAAVSPYHLLSQSPRLARDSILLAPSLHAVTGVWSAIRRRHTFLVVVAFMAILSEFMPILLNNVPMRITQTYMIHQVCTWLAVGILCLMWLVIAVSFFVKWPHMPADPSTVAGSMYYVCDSWMLYSFEGLSTLKKKDRDWKVGQMGFRYGYGDIQGVSGLRRYGVDGIRGSH